MITEYRWRDDTVERCEVHAQRDGLAYVTWPESVREIPALGSGLFERPAGWVDSSRVTQREDEGSAPLFLACLLASLVPAVLIVVFLAQLLGAMSGVTQS